MDERKTGTLTLKTGLAEMLKGGVIMDVTNPEPGDASPRTRAPWR